MSNTFAIDPPLSFIEIEDNLANAFSVFEGNSVSGGYIGINTTDGSEIINFGNSTINPDYTFIGNGELSADNITNILLKTSSILNTVNNGLTSITGNTAVGTNSYAKLYGSSNATKADYLEFQSAGSAGISYTIKPSHTHKFELEGTFSVAQGVNNYLLMDNTFGFEKVDFGSTAKNPDYNFLGNGTATISGSLIASSLTYPTSDGTINQVIETNGAGNLSFVTLPATATPGGVDGDLQFKTGTSFTGGGPNWDGNQLLIEGNSPQLRLQQISDNTHTDLGSGSAFFIINVVNNTDELLHIRDDGVTRFTIDDVGNIGITTAGASLNVGNGFTLQHSSGAASTSELFFKSKANFEITIDSDSTTSDRSFKIKHDAGTDLFDVNESGVVTFGGMKYPTSPGTNGQVMTTDGVDTLTFTTIAAGGTPGGAAGDIQYNNAGAFGGFGDWDGNRMTVDGIINSTQNTGGMLELERADTTVTASDTLGVLKVVSNDPSVTGSVGQFKFYALENFSSEVKSAMDVSLNDDGEITVFTMTPDFNTSLTPFRVSTPSAPNGATILYESTAAALDEKNYRLYGKSTGDFVFSLFSDTNVEGDVAFSTTRTGTTLDTFNFPNGGINIGGGTYDASALLQLTSTTQGLLFPVHTTAQKLAVTTPANGLFVFDSNFSTPQWFDGQTWLGPGTIRLTNRTGGTLAIGECVKIDSANDNSVIYTTTGGDERVIGPVVQGGANLSEVVIARGGTYECLVRSTDSVSPGDLLETNATDDGLWRKDASFTNTSAAEVLETSASGSDRLVKCLLGGTLLS